MEELRISEYRKIPGSGGSDDYAVRKIVTDPDPYTIIAEINGTSIQNPPTLFVNDFALTHDRVGMDKTDLRTVLWDYPESVQKDETITCKAGGENTSASKGILILSRAQFVDDDEKDPVKYRKYFDPGENKPLEDLTWTVTAGTHVCGVKYFGRKQGETEKILLAEASFNVTVE